MMPVIMILKTPRPQVDYLVAEGKRRESRIRDGAEDPY